PSGTSGLLQRRRWPGNSVLWTLLRRRTSRRSPQSTGLARRSPPRCGNGSAWTGTARWWPSGALRVYGWPIRSTTRWRATSKGFRSWSPDRWTASPATRPPRQSPCEAAGQRGRCRARPPSWSSGKSQDRSTTRPWRSTSPFSMRTGSGSCWIRAPTPPEQWPHRRPRIADSGCSRSPSSWRLPARGGAVAANDAAVNDLRVGSPAHGMRDAIRDTECVGVCGSVRGGARRLRWCPINGRGWPGPGRHSLRDLLREPEHLQLRRAGQAASRGPAHLRDRQEHFKLEPAFQPGQCATDRVGALWAVASHLYHCTRPHRGHEQRLAGFSQSDGYFPANDRL